MKYLSLIEAEILLDFARHWARATDLESELLHAGALSARKRYCALWLALFPPLTLGEIARETETGVTADTLAHWRMENDFRTLSDAAAKQFAKLIAKEVFIATFGDKIRRLVLTSLWVRLPGFDIANNPVIDGVNKAIKELKKDLANRNIMRAYRLLVNFRDVLRLAKELLKTPKWAKIEKQAHEVISPLLEIFETRVKEGRKKGLLDNVLTEGLLNTITSIEFLCATQKLYSEVQFEKPLQ
jgi:hypothetical protein